MGDLADGESVQMQGSGSTPYTLKNVGGVYSCTCPAWRNQSIAIEKRSCKHLRKLRGDAQEETRIGSALPGKPVKKTDSGDVKDEDEGPPVLLAESWDNAQDLSGWWMSEKLDGVRAYWDGKQFLSRQGNLYHAPDWFVAGLPEVPLDGELWIDRKKFQRTVSIVRRQDKSEHWKEILYLVFDAPGHGGVFEERIGFIKDELARRELPYARAHEHQVCRDEASLRAELARVEALGGEGLMLRRPGSKYVAGRSSTLLKVKSFRDAEAVVTGHQAGDGRHKGRLGALLVKLPDGTQCKVGTGFSDKERENPPPIGAIITFRYQELSDGGVPRFPSFVRMRSDLPGQPIPRLENSMTKETTMAKSKGDERYFEYSEGSSSKFWAVSQSGPEMTTRWGRIGSEGQTKTKAFSSDQSACEAMESLIEEKTEEGYQEKKGSPSEGKPVKTANATPAKKASAPATAGKSSDGDLAPRHFEFVDGGSSKFWEVSTRGNELTTRWGRIGMDGQSKTKAFASDAKAREEAGKLIEEKTGKGYEEKERDE